MKNTTHKVVILENFSSPYIQQAIIILKNHTGNEDKVLFEAEKIVSSYIEKNTDSDIKIYKKPVVKRKKKSSTGTIIVSALFIIGIIALIRSVI